MSASPEVDLDLTRRVADAEAASVRQTEVSIQRTRTWCVVVGLAQTAMYHGDRWWVGWIAIAGLIATCAWTEWALRAEHAGSPLPVIGGVSMTGHDQKVRKVRRGRSSGNLAVIGWVGMAGDTLVCALVLANLQANPNDPIQFLPLILVTEAAARWGWGGGMVGGLGGGVLGAGWTLAVHRRHDLDLPAAFVTFRVVTLVLVGGIIGNIVRQARQQRRAADAVFNASRDLVATFALDGSLLSANPACEAILGYTPEELLGRDRSFLLDLDDRPDGPVDIDRYRRDGPQLVELRFVHKDGHLVWIELDLLPDLEAGVVYAIGRDVSSRRKVEVELRRRADHDALTGVWNRESLVIYLTRMLDRDYRPGLVFVDLDDFKGVNDSYGHVAGDKVLVAIAERLCGAAGPEGSVGRYAGDEFCVVVDDPADLEGVAARIGRALDEPIDVAGTSLAVSATLGLAVGRVDDSPETLVDRADRAMYDGKGERALR